MVTRSRCAMLCLLVWAFAGIAGGSFTFLGFEYRRILGRNRKWRTYYAPKMKKRTALLAKLKEIFRQNISQPVERVIEQINPILRALGELLCRRRFE